MYHSRIKLWLFIILIGIFLPGLPIQAVENPQKLLQKDNRLTNLLMSNQNIYKNLATEMIENIWLIDRRPEGITIEWKFKDFNKETSVKILRLHEGDKNPPLFIERLVDYDEVDRVYRYIDKTATDIVGFYNYYMIMDDPIKPLTSYLSKLIFTVRQPKLKKWWDWQDNANAKYIDGINDTLFFDRCSLTDTVKLPSTPEPIIWQADSIRYRINDSEFSKWYSLMVDEKPIDFLLIEKIEGKTHGETVTFFIQTKDKGGNTSRWSWRYQAIVNLEPPACIKEIYGEVDSSFYLCWEKPSQNAKSYQIQRKIKDDLAFKNVGLTDELCWEDDYNLDELISGNTDSLLAFEYYEYRILGRNSIDNVHLPCNSCAIFTDYCKRSPIIISAKSLNKDGTVQVKWKLTPIDRVKYPLYKIRFEIRYYKDEILPTNQSPVRNVDGNTECTFNLPFDHQYWFEVRARIIENHTDTLVTMWSRPYFFEPPLDIPLINQLELQPQPVKMDKALFNYNKQAFYSQPSKNLPRIFVSWDKYWELDFWNKNGHDRKSLVSKFEVKRFLNGSTEPPHVWEFRQDRPEWCRAGFMDTEQLVPQQIYRYEIHVYQALPSKEEIDKSYVSTEVRCDTGRIFIPEIDLSDSMLYFRNPSKRIYFDGINEQLIVKWKWPDISKKKCAVQIIVEISNNPLFKNEDLQKVRRNTISIGSPEWNEQKATFDKIVNPTWTIQPDDFVFLRITANDRWNNIHNYWSTDWDSVKKVFNDATFPDPTNLTVDSVRAVFRNTADKVQVFLSWNPKSVDAESGVKYYHIIRGLDTLEAIEDLPISPDKLASSYEIDLSKFSSSQTNFFRIECEDFVKHRQKSRKRQWFALSNPEIIRLEAIDEYIVEAEWDSVPGASGYYIEWCGLPEQLGNPELRKYSNVHHVDTTKCKMIIERDTEINKKWFHVLAYQGDNFKLQRNESGWSEAKQPKLKSIKMFKNQTDSNFLTMKPLDYSLGQNFPNPFNAETKFEISVPEDVFVNVRVINSLGLEVKTIYNEFINAGNYLIHWDGRDISGKYLPSGLYFIIFKTPKHTLVNKCLILR